MNVCFRPAVMEELPEIMAIYARARQFMKETGNPTQWGDTHPSKEAVRGDIERQQSIVCVIDGQIEGVFYLAEGADPTYDVIEDGAWHSDRPYHTIHRIASSGRVRGVFSRCVDWAHENYGYLRIDTHEQNIPMQNALKKQHFTRRGVIYIHDGTPRLAYDKIKEN